MAPEQDTRDTDYDKLRAAVHDMKIAIAEALKIPQLLDWLTEKINKRQDQ